MASNDGNMFFEEKQFFRQWWLWVILIGINGIFWLGFIQQLARWQSADTGFGAIAGMFVLVFAFGLFTFLFFIFGLETRIDIDGIHIRFIPFNTDFKHYTWDKISRYHIRKYHPLREYGGWGIRGGVDGMAYNVSGDRGLQLEMKDGKKILIGTGKPDEMEAALARLEKSA